MLIYDIEIWVEAKSVKIWDSVSMIDWVNIWWENTEVEI